MSRKVDEKEDKDIEEMRRAIPELEETAFRNFYWILLRTWLIFIIVLPIGMVIGEVILPYFNWLSITPLEPSKVEEMANSILGPSVTIYGLSVTFVPVISFFFINEIKEKQQELKEEWKDHRKKYKKEEDLKVVNSIYNLSHTLWHNIRSGVLKYTRTHLVVSIFSLILLMPLYILTVPRVFLAIDFILLIIILAGSFPVIMMALYKPALRLVKYVIPERIVTKIEYEN